MIGTPPLLPSVQAMATWLVPAVSEIAGAAGTPVAAVRVMANGITQPSAPVMVPFSDWLVPPGIAADAETAPLDAPIERLPLPPALAKLTGASRLCEPTLASEPVREATPAAMMRARGGLPPPFPEKRRPIVQASTIMLEAVVPVART